MFLFFEVVVLVSLLTVSYSKGSPCPLWHHYSSTEDTCQCGDDLGGVVVCDEQSEKISLRFYNCMTYSKNQTVVGPCLRICANGNCHPLNQLQSNSTDQINEEMCGKLYRTGQLCGSCRPGYGLPAYSYTLKCVNCTRSLLAHSLVKYITITFLPLTVFYLIVVTMKIVVTSGNMVAFVLVSQLVTMPALLRSITQGSHHHNYFLMSWFTLWNLDMFRSLSSPFCIHPNLNILHMLTLDYLVGVYPLFLIFLTYIAVMLHDRYPIVVKLWSPGQKFFRFLRKEWDIRGSLVQTFATFLILSYVKILNTSFDLLSPVNLKNSFGESLNKTFLFINADIEYFGTQHRPYAILAVTMLILFNIFPMVLLLLYPCRCFQKCLNKCGLNSLALSTFMDTFQGCYQHSPRDYRYFAGLYLAIRLLFLLTISLAKYPLCIVAFGFYYATLSTIIALTKPYKVKWHNKVDMLIF